ncbi:hypothetical protein F4804DRAFT_109014 [Jackrogersella minutella]|nr:hypothetical protein F4804DRAFT_109014 [Jackrogersella minutella]
MDLTVGSHAVDGDTSIESVECAVPHPPPTQLTGRKKGTSCARCRRQKIRCDDNVPSCGNCTRVGQICIRTHFGNNPDVISHINNTEARVRLLEDVLRRVAPEELAKLPYANKPVLDAEGSYVSVEPTVGQPRSPREFNRGLDNSGIQSGIQDLHDNHLYSSPSNGIIKPSDPLAHEVGLLSLTNSRESKYLGPSSGVPFARLIFSTIPQSQGLAANWVTSGSVNSQGASQAEPFPLDWTSEVDLQHFVDAYFDTLHPLHPFLDEDAVSDRLEILYTKQSRDLNQHMPRLSEIESAMSPIYSVQIFLIIALGARILETRLSTHFSSDRYLATAQTRIENLRLPLHDSVEGLQTMLLLTLSSFYFENGPNAWFINSNIIASCLDLGFQRRWMEIVPGISAEQYRHIIHRRNIRSAIFWSAYSIDRNLAVVLGRPLTLRDEAIDVEFPGEGTTSYQSPTRQDRSEVMIPTDNLSGDNDLKRPRIDISQYVAAHYSFRLDRIVAEIKLMLHRVINLPERFPWPTDLAGWQRKAHASCDAILDEVFTHLKKRSRRSSADIIIRSLELKYHYNLMLLHRPSPAITQPTLDSWKICYNSAVKTILIYSDLHRFSKLTNSWVTAHTVFISGITFVYCLWAQPQIKNETSLETFTCNAAACKTILMFLGRTWSVAADAVEKFERLIQMTSDTWRAEEDNDSAPVNGTDLSTSPNLASQCLPQDSQGYDTDQHGTDNGDRNEYDFEPTSFYTELGDVGAWFDLDWILSMNTGPSGEIMSYPGS